MSEIVTPWVLPSAMAFLDEVETAIRDGGAIIESDPTLPDGFEAALTRRLHALGWKVKKVLADSESAPASVLGKTLGLPTKLESLLQSAEIDKLLVVDLAHARDEQAWITFLARFLDARRERGVGFSILASGIAKPDTLPQVAWGQRLRRVDSTIWADLHAPLDRPAPLDALSAALATELCGWRLDLVAALARASDADLLDPISWLNRRGESSVLGTYNFAGRAMDCPLTLRQAGRDEELARRIWRAQLAALYPWIEDIRQRVIARHRRRLFLDEHLRMLGVSDIEEIEFGAIAWQLSRASGVAREEQEVLQCFARVRNALAHRLPARVSDLQRAISRAALW